MNYINIGITILLFALGWLVRVKKTTWLISGYNTSSKEDKAKYDIDKLTKHVGSFLYILGFIWGVMAVLGIIFTSEIDTVMISGMIVLTITIVCGVIWLNTGNRV